MRLVVQRVANAKVEVENNIIGSIKNGFLVLLGVGNDDETANADYLLKKLVNLRVFIDEQGKMNLSPMDIQGELLIVSQFTLYDDCKKGNRPSFTNAAPPEKAKQLYEYFVLQTKNLGLKVETGSFGAHMKVELLNDGPVTILLEN